MTWTSVPVAEQASTANLVEHIFTTHVTNLPKWDVNDAQHIRYDIRDVNYGTAEYMYYTVSGGGLFTALTNGNGAADWTQTVNGATYYGASVDSTNYGNARFWTSDQNPNSFFYTANGAIKFLWLAPENMNIDHGGFPSGVTSNNVIGPCLLGWGESANNYNWYNIPADQNQSPTNYPRKCMPSTGSSGSYDYGRTPGKVLFSGLTWNILVSTSYPAFVFSTGQNDVLGDVGGTYSTQLSGAIKVTDGTNWWLRLSSNLSYSSIWLDMGTTEPVY